MRWAADTQSDAGRIVPHRLPPELGGGILEKEYGTSVPWKNSSDGGSFPGKNRRGALDGFSPKGAN
ncbi:hypothetical protein [Pasteuria penetrans]|uniref:hypothetical protein n=1 Tax=Pasteuria penetrans TaxID=86005 RepID=UPI000FB57154|nr:hypothetical protein [Pasteuria penetrans]